MIYWSVAVFLVTEETAWGVLSENLLLEISQNLQEDNFIEKGNLAQTFSCEFCEIS